MFYRPLLFEALDTFRSEDFSPYISPNLSRLHKHPIAPYPPFLSVLPHSSPNTIETLGRTTITCERKKVEYECPWNIIYSPIPPRPLHVSTSIASIVPGKQHQASTRPATVRPSLSGDCRRSIFHLQYIQQKAIGRRRRRRKRIWALRAPIERVRVGPGKPKPEWPVDSRTYLDRTNLVRQRDVCRALHEVSACSSRMHSTLACAH